MTGSKTGSDAINTSRCRKIAPPHGGPALRTKLSTCARKKRYPSLEAAVTAARAFNLPLLPYRCDRCARFHLTSRTKGKRVPGSGLGW